MRNLEVMAPGIDDRDASLGHMAQKGYQCSDSRITATDNYNFELLIPGYVKWQKRHYSSFTMQVNSDISLFIAIPSEIQREDYSFHIASLPALRDRRPTSLDLAQSVQQGSTNVMMRACILAEFHFCRKFPYFRGILSGFQFSVAHPQNVLTLLLTNSAGGA